MDPLGEFTTGQQAVRRGREIEFLARELYEQVEGVLSAVGDLVPAELAAGELAGNAPLRSVAERLEDALTCLGLLQEELGYRPDCCKNML